MFRATALNQRQIATLDAFALAVFAPLMLAMVLLAPERFPPRVEAHHFLIVAVCLPGIWLLLGQLAAMRARLRTQRSDLKAALERIEAVSIRNELTGLVSRRHMTTLLEAEVQRRARHGAFFCIALIDLDNFKR